MVERRLVALLFLMVGVFRLTTPLLRQWLMIHPRPLAGLRLSGGFGYLDAPPALSPILGRKNGAHICAFLDIKLRERMRRWHLFSRRHGRQIARSLIGPHREKDMSVIGHKLQT